MGDHRKPPPQDNPTPNGPPGNSDGRSPAVSEDGKGKHGGGGQNDPKKK